MATFAAVPTAVTTETITENQTPLAGGGSLTLMNLLLMIGASGIALALVVTYFRKKNAR